MERKGTVTPISSVFPADEAQKASKRVQDTIEERQQQLEQVKGFIRDNVSLINLVQKLPEETHHNIMVPFGKAAFFPGRLIHTNEFMVLLGEGYYAERTSKQTIDILKRRGKTLENQVESLKAVMQDLKAEASFFHNTAHESIEGLVEIREDYVEEDNSRLSPSSGHKTYDSVLPFKMDETKATVEDEEYNRIFSRMAELEKEEEEAEKAEKSDEDEQITIKPQNSIHKVSTNQIGRSSPVKASEVPMVSKDVSSSHGIHQIPGASMQTKASELPAEKEKKAQVQTPLATSNTAFTGVIVERMDNNINMEIPKKQTNANVRTSSRPPSRFKAQREREREREKQ
ncbi:uncharacterized protein LOC127241811 [Andrographis paniculata]|uniref:uncharacterized protein LOC127241811 n=1 Tax=Andrographis paniculata TaxID=175694 RepID=UPI0021E8E205|nr:uncharacterized protein LOC127241811 [Andrographis paniculata]